MCSIRKFSLNIRGPLRLPSLFQFENPIEIVVTKTIFKNTRWIRAKKDGFFIFMDPKTSDSHVISEVIQGGLYDDSILDSAKNKKHFRYLNLGANIGSFEIRIAQLVEISFEGYAIEMNPMAFAKLVANVEINNLSTIHCWNAALWNEEGFMDIDAYGRDTGQRCENKKGGWPVSLVSWQKILKRATSDGILDLVKIDIEGAEALLFPQMLPRDATLIRNIVIETHGRKNHELCEKTLAELKFVKARARTGAGETILSFWKQANPKC